MRLIGVSKDCSVKNLVKKAIEEPGSQEPPRYSKQLERQPRRPSALPEKILSERIALSRIECGDQYQRPAAQSSERYRRNRGVTPPISRQAPINKREISIQPNMASPTLDCWPNRCIRLFKPFASTPFGQERNSRALASAVGRSTSAYRTAKDFL